MKQNWYVVYTRTNAEKKVAMHLAKKGFEAFCPLNCLMSSYHDRKKLSFEPMFKNFVFVKTSELKLKEITNTSDVINLVYWLNKPATIKDAEVEDIKLFLNEFKNVQLEHLPVNQASLLHITEMKRAINSDGGSVVAITRNDIVKLTIPSLGYVMIAEIEKTNAEVFTATASIAQQFIPSF